MVKDLKLPNNLFVLCNLLPYIIEIVPKIGV